MADTAVETKPKEEVVPPTDKAILEKTAKGEKLSKAEEEFIKGTPKEESQMAEEQPEEETNPELPFLKPRRST